MSEGIVSDLVVKALEALGKLAVKEAIFWWGAQDDLEELNNTMRLIEARVHDAEERQEADSSKAIKQWLGRLKLVLYQADDLFDEVLTRDRQKQQMESRLFGKVGILFSKNGPLYFNKKLAEDIKSIRKQLDAIKSDMSVLNLRDLLAQELPMARLKRQRESAPLNYGQETKFISRDTDQNNIIEMLFDPKYDSERVIVIPIVGFGGLGKTTLAQLVFNDERVKKHFDLTKWAYVPEKNDLFLIKSKIYQSFTEKSYNGLSLDQIQRGIVESVKAKKYLLVLDDVWDEDGDRLVNLMDMLQCGKQGSKIIITTRSPVVALEVVDTISTPYKLGTLTDDQSWDLFKSVAFKQGKEYENSNFTKIGKEIVKMCGNVPLAIKVVGGFLRTKDTKKEWLVARDAQRSKAQLTKGADIMDVLKLSYDYLPPTLKQCFAYCSLFPKGWRFDKDDLVYMWMAQGYVEPTNKEIGEKSFLSMLERGYFHDLEFLDGTVKYCKMHDLLHDLAQHVDGEESMVLHDESSSIQNTRGLVHVNLNSYKLNAEVRSSLFVARRMRSFLSTAKVGNKDLKDLISRMQHLRVLQVELSGNDKLPNGIGRLMHLRYLYIQSNIEYLPDFITRLENLQTLNVQHCKWLKELPSEFAKLTNIRHLLLPNDYELNDLPGGFAKLTSLQVLNKFIVGENNGIDSLPVLNYRGELVISFKKWRRNCILEAQRANLKHCNELTSLMLRFDEDVSSPRPPTEEINEMLMNLQLPPNLTHLIVSCYKGDKMPSRWLDGLSKLFYIRIVGCRNCKVVPHLSQLPHLELVELLDLEDLEMEEEETEEEGNNTRIIRKWQGLTSLRGLRLEDILKMKKLPAGIITNLTTLEFLDMRGLENLIELPEEIGNLSLLRQLYIWDCPKLKSFPTSLQGLTALEKLVIKECPNLESLPTSLQGLTSLKHLIIRECPELKSLPTSILSHTSLWNLEIRECPHLEERYRSPDGEDCHLIQHIRHVTIV